MGPPGFTPELARHPVAEGMLPAVYEFRNDYLTDRLPWIILKYPLVPEHCDGRNEDFMDELDERFGDTVTPFAIRTDNDNLVLARTCGISVLPSSSGQPESEEDPASQNPDARLRRRRSASGRPFSLTDHRVPDRNAIIATVLRIGSVMDNNSDG